MSTDELTSILHQLQASHASLAYSRRGDVAIYAPGVRVPERIRRAIREQLPTVLAWMRQADVRTCCSPGYHRSTWRYAGAGRYVCGVCERIAAV